MPGGRSTDVRRREAFYARLRFGQDDTEKGRAKAAALAAKVAAAPEVERHEVTYIGRERAVNVLPRLRSGGAVLPIQPHCEEDYDASHIAWCITKLGHCGISCGLCAAGDIVHCASCVICLSEVGDPECRGCALVDGCTDTGPIQEVRRLLLVEQGGKPCEG